MIGFFILCIAFKEVSAPPTAFIWRPELKFSEIT